MNKFSKKEFLGWTTRKKTIHTHIHLIQYIEHALILLCYAQKLKYCKKSHIIIISLYYHIITNMCVYLQHDVSVATFSKQLFNIGNKKIPVDSALSTHNISNSIVGDHYIVIL